MEGSWLMAVDGTGLLVRCAKAARYTGMTAPDGTPTGALTLFASSLAAMVRPVQPQYLLVAWDGEAALEWRRKICPEYKGRSPGFTLNSTEAAQAAEFCEAAGIAQWALPGFEADDMLAAASRASARDLPGTRVILASDDSDADQLAESGRVWIQTFGRNGILADAEEVKALWGVPPKDIPALRALAGDRSDGIPGVRGVGPVRAALILYEASFRWPLPAQSVPDPADYSQVLAWHDVMNLIDPPEAPDTRDETGILDIRKTEWERGNILPVLEKYAMSAMAERWSKGTFW